MQDKGRFRAVAIALGAIVLGGYLYNVAPYWSQISDQTFVTLRYARNLAEGRGPYFNAGEHVEGYPSFLMMLTMAGAIAAFGPDEAPFVAKLIDVSCGLIAIVGAWLLCARWLAMNERLRSAASTLAWTAGALVAANAAVALHSTTGAETLLFSALIVIGLCVVQLEEERGRWFGSGVVFALAALTRPEGLFLYALVAVVWIIPSAGRRVCRKRLTLDAVIVLAVVAGHVALRMAFYDGQWVSNLLIAQFDGNGLAGSPLDYVWHAAVLHYGGPLALLAGVPLLLGDAEQRRRVLPAGAVLIGGIVVILSAGTDWSPGFGLLAPYAPVWAALTVTGLCLIVDRVGVYRIAASAVACIALVIGLLAWQWPVARAYRALTQMQEVGFEAGNAALADWLNENASPGDSVALKDIGLIGYRCMDLRIIDLTGLTDRMIALQPGRFLEREYDPAYILDQKPTFLVIVNTAPVAGGGLDPAMLARFMPIEEWIVQSQAFGDHYYRPTPPTSEAPEEQLRSMFGAERIDVHMHPGMWYFLTTYRYDPEVPATQPQSRPASRPTTATQPTTAPASAPTSRPDSAPASQPKPAPSSNTADTAVPPEAIPE